jgi:uncharacterized membrane protein YgaE (UPF0421/DUF939 family)
MKKLPRLHIGLRTLKTVAAVIISMLVVELYGTTTSKLIFAMLGAMAAMEPTFTDSLQACITQIVGVFLGAVAGVLLQMLPLPPLVATGIGLVLVITLYNLLHIRFSPSLPCFIVVMVCTTPDVVPMEYALGRIWDTAIGLSIGLLINTLVFPYDNSRQIRATVKSLDRELLRFLEDMFDVDEDLPDPAEMTHRIDTMSAQLTVFSNQRLFLRLRRQKAQLEKFRLCQKKARELLARMEVLSSMGRPGRLNEESRRRLEACGAQIRDQRPLDAVTERDVVTNYHIAQILRLRRELLDALPSKTEVSSK